jgi:hypothetical protein
MGKSTICMAMFNSYVSLPEGIYECKCTNDHPHMEYIKINALYKCCKFMIIIYESFPMKIPYDTLISPTFLYNNKKPLYNLYPVPSLSN